MALGLMLWVFQGLGFRVLGLFDAGLFGFRAGG